VNSTSATTWNSVVGNLNRSAREDGEVRIASRTNGGNAFAVLTRYGGLDIGTFNSSVNINDGKWHWIVATRQSATNIKSWVDGVQVNNDTINAATSFGSPTRNLTIGWNAIDNTYVTGYIDDLIILNGTAIDGSIVPRAEFMESAGAIYPPIASFTASNTTGIYPPALPVKFTDTSTNTPTSWQWDFTNTTGNNTAVTFSTTQSPLWSFDIGNFSISLTATNADGSDVSDQVTWINVSAPTTVPLAEFTGSPLSGTVPLSVTFTDADGTGETAWEWIFGDGNTTGNSEQNPVHLYTASGVYTVNHSATNVIGTNWTNKTGYVTVTNVTGFTPQDIWMEGQYLQTFHITDANTGLPIPVVELQDSSMQTFSTTNGTGYLTEPFGASAVVFLSTGYYGKSVSYVFDSDESHDVQLTPETGDQLSDWAATHNVKFTVRSLFGGPIDDVNVTAVYVETSGPIAWLSSWAGVPDAVNIQNTTLTGHTGTDGAIDFLMVESVQYEITAYKVGEVDKTMKIYPKDDYYTIWADVVNKSVMFDHGYNELEKIQIKVNGTEINSTYGRIHIQYTDLLAQTTTATIYINQTRSVGNATTETTVASYTSVASGNFTHDFDIAGTRDQSYTVRCNGTGTVFPVVRRDFGVTFKPGPISFGIPEELLVYVGMVALIFIALCFVRTLPGPATIVIMFFAWIFYFMGWWRDLGSEVIVVLALIIYSTLAIVFNVMIRSKKRFFE
jgi:PKD repeat protein